MLAFRYRKRSGATAVGWWERALRVPAALAVAGSAVGPAPAPQAVRLEAHALVAAAALWLGLLLLPNTGRAGRLLWPALALAVGGAEALAGRSALVSPEVVFPLLATLPLDPLLGLVLLAGAIGVVLRDGAPFANELPWSLVAWAIIVAATLLRQLAAERRRAATLLSDCVQAVAAASDADSLQVLRRVAGADDVALLRGDPQPPGITAVERPFLWLQGDRLREETALVAQGMVRLPAAFPSDRASLDLPAAPGSKLFITGGPIDGDTRLLDLARLIGLRESQRWMSDRLRSTDYSALESLVQALDARDPYTRGHSERVARYAVAIGKELGMSADLLDELQRGGMLHDIGKIGIPEHILQKPERLTQEEYAIMQKHVKIGVEIIDAINSSMNVLDVVSGHHEHHNGTGYPRRLQGEHIPLLARIAHVADSFEAMTSARSYNQPRAFSDGVAELRRCAGTQFHPEIVEAFAAVVKRDLSS